MPEYTLDEFLKQAHQRPHRTGFFELESERLLEVNLQAQSVWIKTGAMVAYVGDIRFDRETLREQGMRKMLTKAVTGEGTRLTKAAGTGRVYLADLGKRIQILKLQEEALFVNGNDLLAMEPCVDWDITVMKKLSAVVASGLFNVKLQGPGRIAISTHYKPMAMVVTKDTPVVTDPTATVAWSGTLIPEYRTDLSLKTFLGQGSGEAFQMFFAGEGFVVVQPYEESTL